jgi:hypothetical protein
MSIVFDAIKTYMNAKQKEGESLQDYTKRFWVTKEVMESHVGGPLIFTKILSQTDGYTQLPMDTIYQEKNAIIEKQVYEQFNALAYLKNSDQAKYGSLLQGLATQLSLGNDQYPKTITDANSVLSNHKFDIFKQSNRMHQKHYQDQQKHEQESEKVNLSFVQMEGKCYCCGKPGHKSPQCRFKDKPKSEWAINKTQQSHLQANKKGPRRTDQKTNNNESTNVENPMNHQSTGWTGVHYQFHQADDMTKWILLDNESTTTIFCNPDMVYDIKNTEGESLDLVTNAGVLRTTQKAMVAGWGEVWYNPQAITNIFSYAEMAKHHRITYDSNKEDAIIVHLPDKQVKFTKTTQGLYVFKPKITPKNHQGMQLINTVEENKVFYTHRQFERAKKARELYHALGTPSVQDFKNMIKTNMISNNPSNTEDVDIAQQIFGLDIGALKGKTVRKTPLPVSRDYIEIPKELISSQKDVVLCIDGIQVNGLNFLTMISKNLQYRTAQYIESRAVKNYISALKDIIRIYNCAGFKITEIRGDNEFQPLLASMSDEFGIRMNFSNPQEHVPEAERNNRVIKERIRATYHRLPFKQLTKWMTIFLVMDSAKKLNFFPVKGGISPYYSPRMILHQKTLDYAKHCKYIFGMYVQAHDEPSPKNTLQSRTLDCLYLRYQDSHQGGHELLHLATNKIIVWRNITTLPITTNIIKQVNDIAIIESMPSGLKINSRTNATLYDSAWIAGVDYHQDQDQDQENNQANEIENENDNQDTEQDYMDPDEIEGLAQPSQQTNQEPTTDQVDQEPTIDQVDQDTASASEVEIVFETDSSQESDRESSSESQDHPEEQQFDNIIKTRSGRVSRPVHKYVTTHQSHLITQAIEPEEYTPENARIIATTMVAMHHQFIQTFSLGKGIKAFGEKGRKAALEEMKQLHQRVVFRPILIEELSQVKKRRAMESLIFLTEKKDGRIKARTCANGSTQREYTSQDEAASPTALTELYIITAVIDAKQGRDVITADIPNAFVQTDIKNAKTNERTIMKIRGQLVDILVEIAPEQYQNFVRFEGNQKILYVEMMKALYGMLQSSLLYYKKFRKDIEEIGFKINPYDPCVANRIIQGKQHTVTWHVDYLKSSHVNPKVNDEFLTWLRKKYASDNNKGEIKVKYCPTNEMITDYFTKPLVGSEIMNFE